MKRRPDINLIGAVTAAILISALAAPAVGGPGAGPATGQPVAARGGSAGGYSLRHISEALPLTDALASTAPSGNFWNQQAGAEPENEPSVSRAILYSLLLPGLGDWYAGNKSRAKMFFVVDAAIWTTFIVFQVQGHQREDSYQEFAQTFAGVASTGHSDDYYSVIGQYSSSDAYESDFKKESRVDLWPDVGYDALESYYLQNRVSDFEEWQWRSFEDRVDYRDLRSSSKLAYRRSTYFLAAAALNRVVASLFAYQTVRSSRSEPGDDGAPETNKGGYRLNITSPAIGSRDGFSAAVSLIRSF